ncbi:hypothetical protein [Nonomuraea wenchangensis]|uniref:Uncharacterized protein n=1 Tax=Nonomuraea wenchangensis TaxID=568860 RepID=A0A1I0LVG4_9ACTN|nr:hypothetical protein [Nonomuraea wenchangensis]SEU46765.1 hypothetical protein SAMN05421811_127140 [Nonomuraea wenchangensis]
MTALFDLDQPCPKCGAAAGVECDPDCLLMQDPADWFDGLEISDADPGL